MNANRFKFRVWDINNQRYGLSAYTRRDETDENATILEPPSGGNFIIEQSTGLFDRNGKLAFEGDIIWCPGLVENYEFCEIKWLNENSQHIIMTIKSNWHTWNLMKERMNQAEIAGNIHENPELFK